MGSLLHASVVSSSFCGEDDDCWRGKHCEILSLLNAGLNPNAQNTYGENPLCVLAKLALWKVSGSSSCKIGMEKATSLMSTLKDHGSNIECGNEEADTVFEYATDICVGSDEWFRAYSKP